MQSERFEMRMDRATIEQLDQWRATQPELPSRAEAVRRLVHAGLVASADDDMRPTLSEKLILSMLCDLARDRNDRERIDPDFVQYAIAGGHYWAIGQKYPDALGGRPDSPELVREVADILEMWNVLEYHFDHLGESDKGRVASEAAPYGTDVKFTGFYANEETPHLSVAEFLIEQIGNYPRFKGRSLNTTRPVVDWYRRMLQVYQSMQESLLAGRNRSLSASDIAALMLEQVHPDNR